jgi:hypothetical protein
MKEVWLGYILLNKRVSTGENIELLNETTFNLCKEYFLVPNREKYALAIIASLLSPPICSYFSSIVVEELVEYGVGLIDDMDERVLANDQVKSHILSIFIKEFEGEITADSFNKVLNLLHKLLEEVIMILGICESKGLNIEENNLIDKVLKLLWHIVVTASIKDNIKANPIKLVSSLLRLKDNHKYVQRAKNVLSKSSLINTDIEAIKELARVLSDSGDKIMQEDILQVTKSVSQYIIIRRVQSCLHNLKL